ncbi:MAG: TniB family NTP-binding protein [Candidatus Hodarchaeales archaeon]
MQASKKRKKSGIKSSGYGHLNHVTVKMLAKPLRQRIKWARDDHFVMYEKARKTVRHLEWIASQPQLGKPNTDLDSISIIGETGTGKSSIVNYYKYLHGRNTSHPDRESYTVAHCTLPDSDLGSKGLFVSILKAEPFSYPLSEKRITRYRILALQDECIRLLRKTGVKIFFVDEIQHALGRQVRVTLNSLKRVLLLSGVPLVPVGVEEAFAIMNLDPQLADRCPVKSYSHLQKWRYGKEATVRNRGEFRKFLAGYEMFLPFPEPSNLQSARTAKLIYRLASGYRSRATSEDGVNTRQVSRLLKAVATSALEEEAECITEEHWRQFEEDWSC